MMTRGEVAAGRRKGARPEARERARIENAKKEWYAVCPHCKSFLKGTPVELMEHRCDSPDRSAKPPA